VKGVSDVTKLHHSNTHVLILNTYRGFVSFPQKGDHFPLDSALPFCWSIHVTQRPTDRSFARLTYRPLPQKYSPWRWQLISLTKRRDTFNIKQSRGLMIPRLRDHWQCWPHRNIIGRLTRVCQTPCYYILFTSTSPQSQYTTFPCSLSRHYKSKQLQACNCTLRLFESK
jgi:hypothetical protein